MAYIGSNPANKPVVASDIDPTVITGQTALAVAPAATDEFLISDAGTLKRLDASLIGGTNTPSFLAYQSSDQALAASTTTLVVFDTEEFDVDNVFTNTASNYKFTVPSGEDGKYLMYVSVSKNNFSGSSFQVEVIRTRSTTETLAMNASAGGSGDSYEVAGNSRIVDCAVGDTYHVTAKHIDSGSRNILSGIGSTFFGAYKIIE